MKTVIFDLDGTISDPSRGITGAINYSLEAMGREKIPCRELLKFIGPPLTEIYGEILPECPEKGIALFREYYRRKGFRENILYPGMVSVLETFTEWNCHLCLATGKKTETAIEVLDYFGITGLFHMILGCGSGGTKGDLLERILTHSRSNAVMIGDRGIDFNAAEKAGIPSIGAKWGFGTDEELGRATFMAESPSQLPGMVKNQWRNNGLY